MPAVNHLLCPVDFSAPSKHALTQALDVAKRLGAKLTVAHVYSLPSLVMPDGVVMPDPKVLAQVADDAQKQLQALVAANQGQGVELHGVTRLGEPAAEIGALAKEVQADWIVLGTHGRTGIEHALLGSVAERVVRQAKVPVLSVREPHDKELSPPNAARPARILCPVDFSDSSRAAVEQAVALASRMGADLCVMHVCPPLGYAMATDSITVEPQLMMAVRDALKERLEALAQELRGRGVRVEAVLADGVPHKAILEAIKKELTGLVVIGTHGRAGFEHLLLGSVAEKVLRRSPVPVLTVPLPH